MEQTENYIIRQLTCHKNHTCLTHFGLTFSESLLSALPFRHVDQICRQPSHDPPSYVCAVGLGTQRQAPLGAFELVHILAKLVSFDLDPVTRSCHSIFKKLLISYWGIAD